MVAVNELALFAGAGGGILGGKLLGWRTVCAVECEPYAACVLAQRQNDGILSPFPIWDNVRTFNGKPWHGIVDVVSGGFPCQDISAAGRGAGIDGERSGLWSEMARIIGEVRPRFVFVENSPLLVGRGLVRVLADLAEMGFDVRWGVIGAVDVGAPHRRERCWIVANACGERTWGIGGTVDSNQRRGAGRDESAFRQAYGAHGSDWADAAGCATADVADAKCAGAWRHNRRLWPWIGRVDRREIPTKQEPARQTEGVADTDGKHWRPGAGREDWKEAIDSSEAMADAGSNNEQGKFAGSADAQERCRPQQRPAGPCRDGSGGWAIEPGLGRSLDGVACGLDKP